MNSARKNGICITLAIQIFGAAAIVSARNAGSDGDASGVQVRDYEAAKTTPQPINLWKVKEYGCAGNPRTAEALRRMERYSYPIELVCPLIDGAAKYTARIRGLRGCAQTRSFESKTNFFHLSEHDLPPGRYQWTASAYTEQRDCLGHVEVIEPVEVFCVAETTASPQNGKHVLLDLRHSAGHIRGWGYYNHAHYMIKELLERAGFQVRVNVDDPLTSETLAGIDLVVMNYYWAGWPGFRGYLESELAAVRRFVHGGGSLLVAGCDRRDGGKMTEAGNQLVKEFGLQLALFDSARDSGRAQVVDEQGITFFDCPVLLQLPVAVRGQGLSLLTFEDIPVAKAKEFGKGRLVVAGVGMSFLDCYLGDFEHREPLHLLLFYDIIRYLTEVDWRGYCGTEFVEQVFLRCPSLRTEGEG